MTVSEKIKKSKEEIKESQKNNVTSDIYNYTIDLKKRTKDKAFLTTIPVNIVAANESFFKETFSGLIDFHEKYLENSKTLIKRNGIKIDMEDIFHITKSSFSLGDLIAYSLKYSSIESILKTFEEISGINIFQDLKELNKMLDEFEMEHLVSDKRPLDKDRIFKNIKEVYEIRNIICHDFLSTTHKLNLTHKQVREYLLDTALLQDIITTICSEKIYSTKYPSGYKERIKDFNSIIKNKKHELNNLYKQLAKSFKTEAQHINLKKNIIAFDNYVESDAKHLISWFNDFEFTVLPFVDLELQHKIKLIDQRIKNIQDEINSSS